MGRISRSPMSENAVELVANRIRSLPPETLEVLRLAACVGNTFGLKTLSLAASRPPQDTAQALWAALQEGLILPTGDAYKFIEDSSAAAQLAAPRGGASEPEATAPLDLREASYRFLHDRVQQTVYALIPQEQRPEVHLRIGQLMHLGDEARGSRRASLHHRRSPQQRGAVARRPARA